VQMALHYSDLAHGHSHEVSGDRNTESIPGEFKRERDPETSCGALY
jgi:hypothetical protein